METLSINTLLFAGKWALIGLVYLILIVTVITVRREMVHHIQGQEKPLAVAPGRLKVIQAGSDLRLIPGKILVLKTETRLGAELNNDLVLTDQYVSKQHARLLWDGAIWWIEDLGSSNGTAVNDRICAPGIHQALQNGSVLKLGNMIFELMA